MRKISQIFAVACCVVCLGIASALSGEPDKKLETECIRPTIMVYANDGQGTGVIIKSTPGMGGYVNFALTCKHVVRSIAEINIYVPGYSDWSTPEPKLTQSFPAWVCALHPEYDIALIVFVSKNAQPVANLGLDERLFISNKVFGAGNAFREFPRVNFGTVTEVTNTLIKTDILTIPGDSGGPVYHNYKLVGLKMFIKLDFSDKPPQKVYNHSNMLNLKLLPEWAKCNRSVASAIESKATVPQLLQHMLRARLFSPPVVEQK